MAEDDPEIVGNGSGGGWYAGTLQGKDPTPAEARIVSAKVAVWDAYDELIRGRITQAQFEQTFVTNSAAAHLQPTDLRALDTARPPACGDINDPCPQRALKVPHVAQSNGYYCGPASGVMIARYKGKRRSAHTGARLRQRKMANIAHMWTNEHNVTPYWSGKFTRGLNKWLYGSNSRNWRYAQVNRPSVRRFKRALRFNIDKRNPFGVSTVELAAEERTYNNHQYNGAPAIGHWIVARGYRKHTKRVLLLDPATSVWDGARRRMNYSSRKMVKRYVDYNGISVT